MIDTENTPAQGLAALRRQRRRGSHEGAPTFIDFAVSLTHSEVVEEVIVADDGRRLFSRVRVRHALPQHSAGTVWAWKPGELQGRAIMAGEVTGMDATRDGYALVLWSLDKGYFNVVEPRDLRSRTVGWRSPRIGRWGVRFDPLTARLAPEAQAVALLGERGQLAVYRPVDAIGPDLTLAEGIRGVAWSPDGERLAVVDGAEISVFAIASGERLWRAARPRPQERACHVAWDPSGSLLFVADADLETPEGPLPEGRRALVECDDARWGPELRSARDGSVAALLPYETRARQISWSDDGARCLLIARPGGLLVWDVERDQPLVQDPTVTTASFGPRGAWMALAEEDSREVIVRWLP